MFSSRISLLFHWPPGSPSSFGLLNLLGAKKTGTFQTFLVLGLLALLFWFVGTGLPVDQWNRFRAFGRTSGSILGTAGMVFVSYIGLTQIASISEEVKTPEKNIPRGMLAAFGTALFVYLVGTSSWWAPCRWKH